MGNPHSYVGVYPAFLVGSYVGSFNYAQWGFTRWGFIGDVGLPKMHLLLELGSAYMCGGADSGPGLVRFGVGLPSASWSWSSEGPSWILVESI